MTMHRQTDKPKTIELVGGALLIFSLRTLDSDESVHTNVLCSQKTLSYQNKESNFNIFSQDNLALIVRICDKYHVPITWRVVNLSLKTPQIDELCVLKCWRNRSVL